MTGFRAVTSILLVPYWSREASNLMTHGTGCLRKPLKIKVAQEGLEPPRGCPQQILSLPCLPFHHWAVRKFLSTGF